MPKPPELPSEFRNAPTDPSDDAMAPGDRVLPEEEGERRAPAGDGTFPCERCGADLRFRPGLSALHCSYCGHVNPIPEREEEVRELDFVEQMRRLIDDPDADGSLESRSVVKCGTCGAEPEVESGEMSVECPFCGSAIVTSATSRRLIEPGGVLPFAVERRQGRALFRDWVRSRWMAPNALKRLAKLDEKLRGVYVPHWTFDAMTITPYTGKKGVTRTRGFGKNRQRYTEWYTVSGTIAHRFDDVLVRGSESLPQEQADKLEPWDLENLEPYDDAYLAGFRAEAYTVDLPVGWGIAKLAMEGVIRRMIKHQIGGDRQRITSMTTEHRGIGFKLVLLPVWISAYRYRGKIYRFLVNARSGEVQGEHPYSPVKIAAVAATIVTLLAFGVWAVYRAGLIEGVGG